MKIRKTKANSAIVDLDVAHSNLLWDHLWECERVDKLEKALRAVADVLKHRVDLDDKMKEQIAGILLVAAELLGGKAERVMVPRDRR